MRLCGLKSLLRPSLRAAQRLASSELKMREGGSEGCIRAGVFFLDGSVINIVNIDSLFYLVSARLNTDIIVHPIGIFNSKGPTQTPVQSGETQHQAGVQPRRELSHLLLLLRGSC
jgi:hypothetical protein